MWEINSVTSIIKQVFNPLLRLLKLKSENEKFQLDHARMAAELDAAQKKQEGTEQKLEISENRRKELEAPEHAKKLGYELCLCTHPPQIMLQEAPHKFKCEQCWTLKNTGAKVVFSE